MHSIHRNGNSLAAFPRSNHQRPGFQSTTPSGPACCNPATSSLLSPAWKNDHPVRDVNVLKKTAGKPFQNTQLEKVHRRVVNKTSEKKHTAANPFATPHRAPVQSDLTPTLGYIRFLQNNRRYPSRAPGRAGRRVPRLTTPIRRQRLELDQRLGQCGPQPRLPGDGHSWTVGDFQVCEFLQLLQVHQPGIGH